MCVACGGVLWVNSHVSDSTHGDGASAVLGFPLVPESARPRPLYFAKLSDELRAALEALGYAPRSVFELPRGEVQDEVNYLLAKAQGIEEGTILASEEEIKLLELEMKANRMLGQRHAVVRVNVDAGKKSVMDLLGSWGSSRHTLRGNTTVEGANRPAVLPVKGVRKGGKVGYSRRNKSNGI